MVPPGRRVQNIGLHQRHRKWAEATCASCESVYPIQVRRRIVKWLAAAFIPIDETNEQGSGSDARVKALENLKVLGNKARFEDEVLRRVSGDGKFWGQDQFRAGVGEAIVGSHDQLKIAAQIPNRRIELSKTDLHAR